MKMKNKNEKHEMLKKKKDSDLRVGRNSSSTKVEVQWKVFESEIKFVNTWPLTQFLENMKEL